MADLLFLEENETQEHSKESILEDEQQVTLLLKLLAEIFQIFKNYVEA